ncbi:TRAP transporter small permease [Clostridium peptidivorans]|uniref:TRAP transporter small permease n=1 Tax=Clostridium peptidivorans TaxID=100174 RepID=UPI000BE2EE70|nr:TRAP transporter small permease [Clostridium peptidivorans]
MGKLSRYYNKLEEYLLVASLIFTVIIVFIQVIMRYLFNSSLSWSEELTRYIFIWQTWLGASVGLKNRKHINIELLNGVLKERGQRVINIIALIIWFGFCIFLVFNGSELVMDLVNKGSVSSGMRIPMYFVYAALPFSAGIMALRLLGQIYEMIIKGPKAKESEV